MKKLNIQKTKILASGPITSWEIDEETWKQCQTLFLGGSKITVKTAEYRRIDAFELWCWRRLLRIPWTARRSNQLILMEINAEYSLEELMLI